MDTTLPSSGSPAPPPLGDLPDPLRTFRDDPDVARLLSLQRVGTCRIQRLLGQGGMGMVFLAEQEEPIRRTVAVKIIRLGLDTRQVLARFQVERQAMARMEHPAIAKVFEAGATEDGRPYFVMEYVPGEPITAFCDRRRLSLRARLELFREVCRAVQHAHQKGTLHRDLKPTNILVAEQDGTPRPKIIDFGMAKSLSPDEEGVTLLTLRGEFLGTPEYASPEQAAGHDLDTRADIYALGVLLYELLLGVVPLAREGAASESLPRFLDRIQSEEPLRPSRRASLLGPAAAALRGLQPSALARSFRGDLDWIVLKALEKDRRRRYSTAAELEADIGRHLRSEPIQAQAPSKSYIFWKAVHRNRGKLAAAAAVLLALLAGLVASTLLYLQAEGRYREVLRLSDHALLAALQREAEQELWPFYTWDRLHERLDRVIPPEVRLARMEDWIAEAQALLERLPMHRRSLASMRAAAQEYVQDSVDLRVKLEEHRFRLESLLAAGDPALEQEIAGEQAALEELEKRIEAGSGRVRVWRHTDPREQWRLEQETRLVEALELLGSGDPSRNVLTDIRDRRRASLELYVTTLSSPQARTAWAEASVAVAQNPRYGGLRLEPQLGLLPLCEDPLSGLYEFWHVLSGARPRPAASGPSRWQVQAETGMVLVLLPGGRFRMGAESGPGPNQDPAARKDEAPVHEVHLEPFFLSKYECTQAQWERWCRCWFQKEELQRNRSFFQKSLKLSGGWSAGAWDWSVHPVEQTLPSDLLQSFRRMGLNLPTEAQWEYAIRAGTSTPWFCGQELLEHPPRGGLANLADASYRAYYGEQQQVDWDDGFPFTAPVGSFAPNPFGLHDMLGNVAEACLDLFNSYLEPPEAGTGQRSSIKASSHQVRGGHFRAGLDKARSAARNPGAVHGAHAGARAARTLTGR